MPIDPRFMGLIQQLSGMSQQQNMGMPIAAQQSGGSSDYGAGSPTGGGATLPGQNGQASQQTAAALNNPQTQAALEGANAPSPAAQRAANAEGMIQAAQSGQPQTTAGQQQPGYGGGAIQPQQQGTALGNQQGQQTPQNLTPEQAAEAQRQAQTASELSLWNTIRQNLTGTDLKGMPLQGEALGDFQMGHSIGGFLGTIGEAIGGNSTGGRLAGGVYDQAAGGLTSNNAARQQEANNNFMKQALAAMNKNAGATSRVGGSYTPFTANSQTGAPAQQAQPSTLADSGQGTIASLDESLARMRRLSGLA